MRAQLLVASERTLLLPSPAAAVKKGLRLGIDVASTEAVNGG